MPGGSGSCSSKRLEDLGMSTTSEDGRKGFRLGWEKLKLLRDQAVQGG